jgi:hypothetical protein
MGLAYCCSMSATEPENNMLIFKVDSDAEYKKMVAHLGNPIRILFADFDHILKLATSSVSRLSEIAAFVRICES